MFEVLTPDTAAEMRTIMARVVQEGTGTAAQVEGPNIIGKTGTAETSGRPMPGLAAWCLILPDGTWLLPFWSRMVGLVEELQLRWKRAVH